MEIYPVSLLPPSVGKSPILVFCIYIKPVVFILFLQLPHGIVHARQRSSPESLGVMIDAPPGTNLKRNNSDAQSKDAARKKHLRSVVGAEAEIRKRSDNIEALGRVR